MTDWQVACLIHQEGRRITLAEPFRVLEYEIPSGFCSDGATVPRLLWPIARPFGSSLPAALLHDYLLSATDLPRWDCDRLFLAALKVTTPYKLRPYVLYAAVRLYSLIIKKDKNEYSPKELAERNKEEI